MIKASPIPIEWNPSMSIFASEPFLRSVGNSYGWLGGFDSSGKVRCVLPYTIVRKAILRMVRFRVATIATNGDLTIEEERAFLNSAMEYFRGIGADLVIPATTNTIFRTYPDGAIAAPYGTYRVDLTQSEDDLWSKVHSKHRNVIRNAKKSGVVVRDDPQSLRAAYDLVKETQARSKLGFASFDSFQRSMLSIGDHIKVLIAEQNGKIQGCAVIPYSQHCAYYLYGGTAVNPATGAMNYLQWEAILLFKAAGVLNYDFVGARINPPKDSKQYGLSMFKERFGGTFDRGYMWKYSLSPFKYSLYQAASRLLRGGDIVDAERSKLATESQQPAEAAADQNRNPDG